MIPHATSVTHQHLLRVILAEAGRLESKPNLNILDVGCGNGRLMAYLHSALAKYLPDKDIRIHGLDVIDHGVQEADFLGSTLAYLAKEIPSVTWRERLVGLESHSAWPYVDGQFDIIISNQVLEHVLDHEFLFGQLRRTLKTGGVSVHLFPLMHCLWEGHLYLPLAHRIRNHDLRVAYIEAMSRLGLGKYRSHRREFGVSLTDYAEQHADYLNSFTSYLSQSQVYRLAARHGLRASLRYSFGLYSTKLAGLMGRRVKGGYSSRRASWSEWLVGWVLRYLSSITLVLDKTNKYERGREKRLDGDGPAQGATKRSAG